MNPPFVGPDRSWQRVFYIVQWMAVGFLLAALVFQVRPGRGAFEEQMSELLRVLMPGVATVWVSLLFRWWFAGRRSPDGVLPRRFCVSVVVALLVPFVAGPVIALVSAPSAVLACVPPTAFGLWLVYQVQRHRRVPVRLYLAVFGWGALVAAGYAHEVNELCLQSAGAYLREFSDATLVRPLCGINAGPVEELAKGAGIAVACLLARRRVDGIVSGMVLGAAVGLGFNLTETVTHMTGADSAATQYLVRQYLDLFAAHTVFSAVCGAGIGAACQLRDPRLRRTAIACGVVAPAGCHALYNVVVGLLPRNWVLVALPLVTLIVQGPLIAIAGVLLRRALRSQGAGLSAELWAETAEPAAAVTPAEAEALASASRRRAERTAALRRGGWAAYRQVRRRHALQLDVAALRWHRSRGDAPAEIVEPLLFALRVRVNGREIRPPEAPRLHAGVEA
ncbi:hypothetical protein Val02_89410 [Virgisporangium aliadipatigenens]|uniref:PrsW family intramembrane metalloprotease n=1 Tax=Virgisporangium aliadipatigenens TaxID=741659 RepID=A0A8J3YYJ8_9ACTN|nr:PrsW family intramembrane metalloprotease [Virgisporangium aliadipatigenens]GIJ52055.1 hypothetical protein Val02_89410 [Virgisporangium aliadipatigenens]